MNETKKVKLNLIISLLTSLLSVVLGFFIPKLIINNYGSDANGLTTTLTQIFTYLALLEAGIGTAAKNALYKPINDKNQDDISYVVSLSKKHFKNMTIIYSVFVIGLSVALPFILKTNLDFFTIFMIVIFEGASNVVSFCFLNSDMIFLNAEGKNFIVQMILFSTKILGSLLKIFLAYFSVNIVFLQVGFFFVSLIKILLLKIYLRKNYPWLKKVKVDKRDKLKDRNSYVITEIAWTVFSSTDMILIGIFVSTQMSSVYSIYNLVVISISGLITTLYGSIVYLLGKYYKKDIETYKRIHNIFNSFFMSLITICLCTAYLLYIPFVKLYTAGVTDISYLVPLFPFLFCSIELMSWCRYVPGNLSGLAGYAKQTAVISLIEMTLNLVLSLVLVQFYGAIGLLIATLISMPLKVFYLNYIAERKIMNRSPFKTISILLVNVIIFLLTVHFKVLFGIIDIDSIGHFVLYGFLIFLGFSVVVFAINILLNKDMMNIFKIIKNNEIN